MKKRSFEELKENLRDSLVDYDYYTDFEKVIKNTDKYRKELNQLSYLVGSKNIRNDFIVLIRDDRSLLKCIPILIAVRLKRNDGIMTEFGNMNYKFDDPEITEEQYATFMEKTGLFDLLANHIKSNLYDYVLGVEAGMDTHARKNRSGNLMESTVRKYLDNSGLDYKSKLSSDKVKDVFGMDVSSITGNNTIKEFDFVVKSSNRIYGIEVNYFRDSGSKPSEVARSYEHLAENAKNIKNFEFIWITDGPGWKKEGSALKGAYELIDNIYCLADLEELLMEWKTS